MHRLAHHSERLAATQRDAMQVLLRNKQGQRGASALSRREIATHSGDFHFNFCDMVFHNVAD